MNPSPLQLERHFFSKVLIEAQPDGKVGASNLLECQIEVGQAANDPLRYQVTLLLKLLPQAGEKPCYTGEVQAIGLFRVLERWPADKRSSLVEVNGSAVLLGAIRELVCNLTARGPWPMVTINTFTFIKPEAIAATAAEPPKQLAAK